MTASGRRDKLPCAGCHGADIEASWGAACLRQAGLWPFKPALPVLRMNRAATRFTLKLLGRRELREAGGEVWVVSFNLGGEIGFLFCAGGCGPQVQVGDGGVVLVAENVLGGACEQSAGDFLGFGGLVGLWNRCDVLQIFLRQHARPVAEVAVLSAEDARAEFWSGIGRFAVVDAIDAFGEGAGGHGKRAAGSLGAHPNDHFPSWVLFELDEAVLGDVEEFVRLRVEGDDVVFPTAMISASGVGFEDDFGMAVVVEILTGHFFVEGDVETASAVDDVSFVIVDGGGADEFGEFGAVDRTQRNFVAVPEFAFEGLSWGRIGAAGDCGLGVGGDGLCGGGGDGGEDRGEDYQQCEVARARANSMGPNRGCGAGA